MEYEDYPLDVLQDVNDPEKDANQNVLNENPLIVPKEINYDELLKDLYSNEEKLVLEATIRFRKLLSLEKNPPINEVIDLGVVPKFIEFLKLDKNPALQFESSWALTNIASGSSEQTNFVIENGAVPIFINLINSPHDDVSQQAIWALGNISGDSARCRDIVLNNGILEPLLNSISMETMKLTKLRNATWTLSNLCRGNPKPNFDVVSRAIPTLSRLIYSKDDEVLTDACWAFSYLSDGSNDKI